MKSNEMHKSEQLVEVYCKNCGKHMFGIKPKKRGKTKIYVEPCQTIRCNPISKTSYSWEDK